MIRFLLRRLTILPPALLIVHFSAFAYAIVAQRFHAARNPFTAPPENPLPILASYGVYVQEALSNFSLGRMPTGGGQPIATVLLEMAGRSAGLFGTPSAQRDHRPARPGRRAPTCRVASDGAARHYRAGHAQFLRGRVLIAISVFYIVRTARPPFPLQGFGWDLPILRCSR
jgi:hypothetical protein